MAQGFLAAVVVCAVTLGDTATPASSQQQRPQFRGGVDLVRLDVSVLDADGRPVRGLTADDFTIRDNGRDYKPSFFEAIAIPLVLETDASWRSEVASDVTSNQVGDGGRLVVIVLDDSALPGRSTRPQDQAKRIAKTVIDQLAPADLAAVVFTLNDSTAQSFTSDKGLLRRAIDGLRPGFTGLGGLGELHFERGSIRTLDFIAEKLIDAPGRRKALVYISGGVPMALGSNTDARYLDLLDFFKRAQRANVAVYSFNPFGVPPRNGEYLRVVAENTGGFSVVDVNNPAESVRRVFEENSAYYLIGYEPLDPPEPGKFRTVDVEVGRPDLRVRTRRGYHMPERERAELTPDEQAVSDAIGGLLPVSQTPMRMHVAPFALPGRDRTALLITAELRQPPPEQVIEQTVRLIISAYDDRGRHRESTEEVLTAFVEPGDQDARIEVLSRLDLKPGRYEIRLANRNPDRDLTGSVFQPVNVPDFRRNGVRLSGVVLATPTAGFTGTREPPEEVRAVVPVTPTTVREFLRGGRATIFARVYQGGRGALEDVDLHVSILAADGRSVIDRTGTLTAAQFEDDRQANFNMELPLPAFAPGEYLLTIGIAGSDDAAATRRVRFHVR
jgi:VWFA-related protein